MRQRSLNALATPCLLMATLFFAPWGHAPAGAQAGALPTPLVLHFDASASALPVDEIRALVAAELGVPVTTEGADGASTLHVQLTAGGQVELVYRPERMRIVRSVPVPQSSALPRVVAQLAGNVVRDEAAGLLDTLCAESARPEQPSRALQREACPAAAPAACPPCKATQSDRQEPGRFTNDRWLTSLLVGGSFGPNEGGSLTLGQARLLGSRVELGLGLKLAVGRADAHARNDDGSRFSLRVTQAQLTVPLTLDVRVLGGRDALLLLGASAGVRIAGVLSGSNLSGSDPAFAGALRATTVFGLRGPHRLLLRASWDPLPRRHDFSIAGGQFAGWPEVNGRLQVVPARASLELGYQVAWP